MRYARGFLAILLAGAAAAGEPDPFVDLKSVVPSIRLDMRYSGSQNFLGRPVRGYKAARCLLTRPAAAALADAQKELRDHGLALKLFDCFRPQRAVDDFVAWARDLKDVKMKKRFYPRVDKTRLFADGYIAEKSGHSRGSTADLTLVEAATGAELDMGTAYDYFDPLAHTANPAVPPPARRNRLLLRLVMEKHGFKNLPDEWWHYTLVNEPYPDRWFDRDLE